MYEDSTSVGWDYQLTPQTVSACTTCTTTSAARSRTWGRLVERQRHLRHRQSGRRAEHDLRRPSYPGVTPPFATPKPKRVYDALELTIERRFSQQLVLQRELHAEPAVRQLRGPLEHRRGADTHDRRVIATTSQQQTGSTVRPGSNASVAWDIDEILWDAHGNLDVAWAPARPIARTS